MGEKPPKNPLEKLPEISSEEDIFLKTKVGFGNDDGVEDEVSDEGVNAVESPLETLEPIDEFEDLDELPIDPSPSEPSLQLEAPVDPDDFNRDRQVPEFENLSSADTLSTDQSGEEPASEQPFVSDFSASVSPPVKEATGSFAGAIQPPTQTRTKTIDSIKNFSESLNAEAPASAQLPFTLRIEGKLTAQESEKLLDALSRESMDIRAVDIEPQLEAGRVLIPRISEYAGILLIQALRGVRAKIFFQPSDPEPESLTDSFGDSGLNAPGDFNSSFEEPSPIPTAESLPVTQGDDLPQLGVFQVIDTLIVSGMLSTRSVEALNSNEFTTLTESLMRELKFKAVRRGARGVTHLSIQLTPLTLPTDYRVTVSGTAVK